MENSVMDAHLRRLLDRGLIDAGTARRARVLARLLGKTNVSGEKVAAELGISRAAVSKHVRAMIQAGLAISATPRLGYSLPEGVAADSLLPEVVIPRLLQAAEGPRPPRADAPLGIPYLYFSETDSTNDVLKDRAGSGLPDGAIAVAEAQRAGRGRLGRSWTSDPGKDLTFSLLLRPRMPSSLAQFTVIVAGLAVVAAVHAAAPELEDPVGIKWPNDVLVGGRKLCGVLTEASIDMDAIHWVVIGVGLNVNGDFASILPKKWEAGRVEPISLKEAAGRSFPRASLLSVILEELAARLALLEAGDTESLLGELASRDLLAERQVAIRLGVGPGDAVLEGVAAGFREDGALMVRTADGVHRPVLGGDVTLRR